MQNKQQLPPHPLAHIFNDQANTLCFQCNKPSKQWTDVAHGIILCLNCAAVYKQLAWATKVKSVGLDVWTPQQVQRMQKGGNEGFRKFLAFYGLQKAQVRTKITSKAAAYYRGLLDGKQVGEQPSIQVGKQIYKQDIPLADMSADQLFESAKEKAIYLGEKTKSLGQKGIKKLQQKYQSGQLKQGAKKVATTVSQGAKWLWGAFKQKASEIASDMKK